MKVGGEVEGREPRLWEELRKTTVSSPGGVAPLVGRQVPSIEGRGHSLATRCTKGTEKTGDARGRWAGRRVSPVEYGRLKLEVGGGKAEAASNKPLGGGASYGHQLYRTGSISFNLEK